MPKELDVPHWARDAVKAMRSKLELTQAVTDRMIYARLIETECEPPEVAEAQLRKLEKEVQDA